MTEKQLEKKILDGGRTLLFSNEDFERLIIPLVIDQVLARTVGMGRHDDDLLRGRGGDFRRVAGGHD